MGDDIRDRPTVLYRLYDAGDALLYVGITTDWKVRSYSHQREKPWWLDVARTTLTWFTTRAEALEAERSAIREELPVYNDVHHPVLHPLSGEHPRSPTTDWGIPKSKIDKIIRQVRESGLSREEAEAVVREAFLQYTCRNCGDPKATRDRLCQPCYAYRARVGKPRPARLFLKGA